MSRLHLWAPWLLFTWELLWLLVQAAPAQPPALDPVLQTSVPLGPTEPWPSDQQPTPPFKPSCISEDFESSLFKQEASALPTVVPEEMEPFPTPQEPPAHQSEDP